MPPKSKKAKGSKLARMSEEERLRYLQYRAELELEAKRRKQQLIAVFTKSKLRREKTFARLNTAKINEQWRLILRQMKCKELCSDLDYLWDNFDRTLKVKDAVIYKLYEEYDIGDLDHRRLQESHIDMMNKLIGRAGVQCLICRLFRDVGHIRFMKNIGNELGKHKDRLKLMNSSYNLAIREIEIAEIDELNNLRFKLVKDCQYLQTVIFAETECTKSTLRNTRIRNAVSIRGIEHSTKDEISLIRQQVGGHIEDLWKRLDDGISEYESSSVNRRKQYEYLKLQDNGMRLDGEQFPRIQSNLQYHMESLRDNQHKLINVRCGRIDELKIQVERFNDKIWESRQAIRINQMMDALRLKCTSVMSVSVVTTLKRIEEKSSSLLLLLSMCSSLEPPDLAAKKYAIYSAETAEETNTLCVLSPYHKMDKFWEQFNHVKAENIHKKREHDQLMLENKRLRHTLRNYLIMFSRIPSSRSQSSV